MSTKLIELEDGTLVEIEIPEDQAQQISGGFADKVGSSFEKIKPLLIRACKPVSETFRDLNKEVQIEQAEVELGLSFEGEGNVYVTRSKAAANLTIKLTLKGK